MMNNRNYQIRNNRHYYDQSQGCSIANHTEEAIRKRNQNAQSIFNFDNEDEFLTENQSLTCNLQKKAGNRVEEMRKQKLGVGKGREEKEQGFKVKEVGGEVEDESIFEDADEDEEEKKAPVVAPKVVKAPVKAKVQAPVVEKPKVQPSYQVNTVKEKSTTVYKPPVQEAPKELPCVDQIPVYNKVERKFMKTQKVHQPRPEEANQMMYSYQTIHRKDTFAQYSPKREQFERHSYQEQTPNGVYTRKEVTQQYSMIPFKPQQENASQMVQYQCMGQNMQTYEPQLPSLNRVSMDLNYEFSPYKQSAPAEVPPSFGFNPFAQSQTRQPAQQFPTQSYPQHLPPSQFQNQIITAPGSNGQVVLAARPMKAVPVMGQNGQMQNTFLLGDGKILIKAVPLQQVIQVPMAMLGNGQPFQPPNNSQY